MCIRDSSLSLSLSLSLTHTHTHTHVGEKFNCWSAHFVCLRCYFIVVISVDNPDSDRINGQRLFNHHHSVLSVPVAALLARWCFSNKKPSVIKMTALPRCTRTFAMSSCCPTSKYCREIKYCFTSFFHLFHSLCAFDWSIKPHTCCCGLLNVKGGRIPTLQTNRLTTCRS